MPNDVKQELDEAIKRVLASKSRKKLVLLREKHDPRHAISELHKLLPSVTPMTDVTLFYGSDVTTRSIAGDMQNNVAREVVMNLT